MNYLTVLILNGIFLSITTIASSQNYTYRGPVSTSLGSNSTTDDSPWAVFSNFSISCFSKQNSIGISCERRYNIEELNTRTLVGNFRTKYGQISASILQDGPGYNLFGKYNLAYSRLFGSKLAVGLQYNYLTHQIEGSELSKSAYSSVGFTYASSSSLTIGILIQNPELAKIKYGNSQFNIPSLFNIGIKWQAIEIFNLRAEVENSLHQHSIYKVGFETEFVKTLEVRLGINTSPQPYSIGAGYAYKKIHLAVSINLHSQLGVTSSGAISYLI